MSRDLMIDIETLASENDAVVVQVGAVEFDPQAQTMDDGRIWNLDYVNYQTSRRVSARTVQWWCQQSPDAIESVLRVPPARQVTPRVMYDHLSMLIHRADHVWARGPSFDLAILNNLFAPYSIEHGQRDAIPFWKWRDERVMRDLVESCGYGMMREGTHHNALDDAKHQTRNVMRAYEIMQKRNNK